MTATSEPLKAGRTHRLEAINFLVTWSELISSSKHQSIMRHEMFLDLNIIDLIIVQAMVLRSKRIALNQEQW
jgi:hypothetical protein